MSVYSRRRGFNLSEFYTAPPMPFWFTANHYPELCAIPGVRAVRELPAPPARGRFLPKVVALTYRLSALERLRAPNTLVEFGSPPSDRAV